MSPSRTPTPARHVLTWLAWLVCALLVATIPGSRVRFARAPDTVELRVPELRDTGDRDAALSVIVVARGAPAAGVKVRDLTLVAGRAYAAGQGTTDAAGRVKLARLPHGEHWILAETDGFARASTMVVLYGGEREVRLELADEHAVTVEVRDDDGHAIAGAEVEVTGDDALPVGARTDDAGIANVRRLAGTKWIVVARAAGFEEVAQRGVREGERPKLVLRKLGAFVVSVVGADGAPAAGARVHIAGATLWPPRMADVKDDGTVRIGSLAAGVYALRATRGGDASPIELGASVARGEEKRVRLQLEAGVIVGVRVMDGEGDQAAPIAGARVTLAEAGVSPFPVEATTDGGGRARLGPVARGALFVSARADGFVARGAVAVPDPPAGELRIALARAGVLSGRVVDARGFPIDGATIQVVGTDFQGAPIDEDPRRSRFREAHFASALGGSRPLIPAGELGVMPGPVPPIPHAFSLSPELPASAAPSSADEPWVTRRDGTFRAAPVSPGRVRALVRHPQYIEGLSDVVVLASGAEAHVDVVLRSGGSLEGRVVDRAGRGVGGAHVSIAATRGSMERSARSATDGTFAFASVPDVVTLMVARPDDPLDVAVRVVVEVPEGGRKSVDVTLPDPRPPLPVRVVDDRGYALDAAQITASSLDASIPLRATSFTNARGEATVIGGAGVDLRLEVSAPGFAAKAIPVKSESEVRVELHAAERIAGEVRSTRGDPLQNAQVVLYTDLGVRHARTDAAGAYAFADLAPGRARLQVRAPGHCPATRDVDVEALAGKRSTQAPRVELAPEAIVEGTVVDARGDPVQGARVAKDVVPVYLAVGVAPVGVAITDAKGRFRIGEIPEGSWTLEAYAADVGRGRADGVRAFAGRANESVRIQLQPAEGEKSSESASRGGVAVTLGESGGETRDVVIVAVAEGSEAERAGLVPGDVLLEVDGAAVHAMSAARAKLSGALADDVVVKLRRTDRTLSLRVPREQVHR